MSDREEVFESWEEVIVDFFKQKQQQAEVFYLKKEIEVIKGLYGKKDFFNDQSLQDFFDAKKNKKIKGQSDIKFQRKKALRTLKLKHSSSVLDIQSLIKKYQENYEFISNKYTPRAWISKASKKSSSVVFATHVTRLTHSSIDSPSLFDSVDARDNQILTTTSLLNKTVDGAVAGNQFAPIFQFLNLKYKNQSLVSTFSDESINVLEDFAINETELTEWNKNFIQSISPRKKATHSLSKQVYFPVNVIGKSYDYHLLCIIKSSSLIHSIFEFVRKINTEGSIKKLKLKGKYSKDKTSIILGKSKISVTKSNHNNASQLNGKRGGNIILFSTQPPSWESQLKPPIYKKTMFDNFTSYQINEDIRFLHDFLLRFKHLDLSYKDPRRYTHLVRWVESIVDEVFYYANSIQKLPASWSLDKNIKLDIEHQYFLDPYRNDDEFQARRTTADWQSTICVDFASWLNRKLAGKEKQFTPKVEHTRLWKKLFEPAIREDCEAIKAEREYNKKEAV